MVPDTSAVAPASTLPPTQTEESPARDGRGENSLALLCQRFCELYKDTEEPINIDHAAKELGIQRRRMYEILNIIQSVGLVERIRASFYRWQGEAKMTLTLEKLKEDGLQQKTRDDGSIGVESESTRRKAVATSLAERFVQIFVCNEFPQPIVLEDIMGVFSSSVSGGAHSNQLSCARRLYDIANVFCSIGLVKKSSALSADHRRKRRLYSWVGPVPPHENTTPVINGLTSPIGATAPIEPRRLKRGQDDIFDDPLKSRISPSRKKAKSLLIRDKGAVLVKVEPPSLEQQLTTIDELQHQVLYEATEKQEMKKPATQTYYSSPSDDTHSLRTSSAPPVTSSLLTEGNVSILQEEVARLKKALEEVQDREKELLKRIKLQGSEISKLKETLESERRHGRPHYHCSPSPLANFVFSPYPVTGHSGSTCSSPFAAARAVFSQRRARNQRKAVRVGPQLVDPTSTEEDGLCSIEKPSEEEGDNEKTTTNALAADSDRMANLEKDKENRLQRFLRATSQYLAPSASPGTPPCHLIATAASSLLSLTPNQVLESPSSLACTFDALSPLPSEQLSNCFS